MSCLVVANALESGDDLDLDQTASRKGGNLEGAARGERGLELRGVDLVHGGEVGDVVKTTVYLADIADFAAFNEVYARYFTSKPARSCVAVKDLPKGVLCEIEAIAEA